MKSVFITGANRGLGKGFVDFFLQKGYLVFAGVRNPSRAAFTRDKNLHVINIDVSDDTLIQRAFQTIQKQVDHLDYLINNAGTNKDSATQNHKELVCNLSQLDRKSLLHMFDINTISPMMVLKEFLPLLQDKRAFVIHISSDRASYNDEIPNTNGNYGYRASKIALNMMAFCSLFDLPKNVQTFAVHPGSVKTDMNPVGTDTPRDQAQKIIAITEQWNEELNGKFLRFDGSLYPL